MKNDSKPRLTSVPKDASAPEPKTYTLADRFRDNAAIIRHVADEQNLDPAVATNIFFNTVQLHITERQMENS